MTSTGVVVMAYGTPRAPDEVEAYYTHIRRGRPPTDDQLADLVRRYDVIGGISPLASRTEAQRAAIGEALGSTPVALGNKHAAPFIEDAVESLVGAGATRIAGVVLAPHYSRASVGEYHARATASLGSRGEYRGLESWHDLDEWLAFQAAAVRDALEPMPAATTVLFTAHSLPARAVVDDPYAEQLIASAGAIAARAGISRFATAWQSAGRTPEPWLGPDLLDTLRTLAADGVGGVVVCPQGFTSDHLEVLYDLDVDAAHLATELGVAFARTRSINADPAVMTALAARVTALLA